jgi:hypothetical protein
LFAARIFGGTVNGGGFAMQEPEMRLPLGFSWALVAGASLCAWAVIGELVARLAG